MESRIGFGEQQRIQLTTLPLVIHLTSTKESEHSIQHLVIEAVDGEANVCILDEKYKESKAEVLEELLKALEETRNWVSSQAGNRKSLVNKAIRSKPEPKRTILSTETIRTILHRLANERVADTRTFH